MLLWDFRGQSAGRRCSSNNAITTLSSTRRKAEHCIVLTFFFFFKEKKMAGDAESQRFGQRVAMQTFEFGKT